MLIIIRSVNFFLHNLRLQKLKFKHLIDDVAINLWYSWNFASIENIIRKFNLTVDLSKFTSNKKI